MIPGQHRALARDGAGTAAIESRRLARRNEADLSAGNDEAAVLTLLADVLVGDSHWTVGELRRLLTMRETTRSD